MRKKLLLIISCLGICISMFMLFSQQINHSLVKHNQQTEIKKLTPKKIAQNKHKKATYDFSKVKPANLTTTVTSYAKPQTAGIGLIAIPAVNLNLPVMKGVSNYALSTGGGTMRPNEKMGQGNYALAGHYMTNSGILFSPIENAQKGQLVYLSDLTHLYTYRIYSKRKVSPHAVWLVNDTAKPIVTLITCADGGSNRWAVRGNLIKSQKASNKQLDQIFGY